MTDTKQPLTESQLNEILRDIAFHTLSDSKFWTKYCKRFGGLREDDLNQVWNYALNQRLASIRC